MNRLTVLNENFVLFDAEMSWVAPHQQCSTAMIIADKFGAPISIAEYDAGDPPAFTNVAAVACERK